MTMCLKEDRESIFATFLSNTCLVLLHFADKKVTIYFSLRSAICLDLSGVMF